MTPPREISRDEYEEAEWFGNRPPSMDWPYWCPSCEAEHRISEDDEPVCPVCNCFPLEAL